MPPREEDHELFSEAARNASRASTVMCTISSQASTGRRSMQQLMPMRVAPARTPPGHTVLRVGATKREKAGEKSRNARVLPVTPGGMKKALTEKYFGRGKARGNVNGSVIEPSEREGSEGVRVRQSSPANKSALIETDRGRLGALERNEDEECERTLSRNILWVEEAGGKTKGERSGPVASRRNHQKLSRTVGIIN